MKQSIHPPRIFLAGILLLLGYLNLQAQDARYAPLPGKLGTLPMELQVNHFPSPLFATTDEGRTDFKYFWKHTTTVVSPFSDAEIVEFGAYIYYDGQWNKRVSMDPKEFEEMFHCPGGKLKKGEPYTFPDNWRTENELRGGWAMWYFIAKNASGKKVAGIGRVYTAGGTYQDSHFVLDPARSGLKWTGHAARTSYAPTGTLKFKGGDLLLADDLLLVTRVEADLSTLTSPTGGIAKHLMSPDFFDAGVFPEAVFELEEMVNLKNPAPVVQGRFSFHGYSVVATFPLRITQTGNEVTAKGTITLDRTQFGITRGSPDYEDNLTDQTAIGNGFEVEVEAVFVRQ